MPGQRRVGIGAALGPAGADRLAIERIGQHRGDPVGPGVGQGEEVTHRHQSSAGMEKVLAAALRRSMNSVTSPSSTISGGRIRTTFSPADTVSSW